MNAKQTAEFDQLAATAKAQYLFLIDKTPMGVKHKNDCKQAIKSLSEYEVALIVAVNQWFHEMTSS